MKKTQKEILNTVANSIRCIAIDIEQIKDLHLCNTVSILLDKLNELNSLDEEQKERNKYFADRLYKFCKEQKYYEEK